MTKTLLGGNNSQIYYARIIEELGKKSLLSKWFTDKVLDLDITLTS